MGSHPDNFSVLGMINNRNNQKTQQNKLFFSNLMRNDAMNSNKQSKIKSTRGGARPGAGRRAGSVKIGKEERRDRREIALELALGGLEHALKTYPNPDVADDDWTTHDYRLHIAMVLLGVPVRIIAAALFKPQTSDRFFQDLKRAIEAVEGDLRRERVSA